MYLFDSSPDPSLVALLKTIIYNKDTTTYTYTFKCEFYGIVLYYYWLAQSLGFDGVFPYRNWHNLYARKHKGNMYSKQAERFLPYTYLDPSHPLVGWKTTMPTPPPFLLVFLLSV